MAQTFTTATEAEHYLKHIGMQKDRDIDILEAAFAFALIDRFDSDIDSYRTRFQEMTDRLTRQFDISAAANNSDHIAVQAESLANIMHNQYGFQGDVVDYHSFKNINLFDVMDRKLGMPITLCILSIALCRAQGWEAEGINFPGHFLMGLQGGGERLILDPFQGMKALEASDMRGLLKQTMGPEAELAAEYHQPCSNRDILLRLQNNYKFRLIDQEDYDAALKIVMGMSLIAPDDYRINLDKAILFSRLDQRIAAIDNIKIYLQSVINPFEKREAEAFLRELQLGLN